MSRIIAVVMGTRPEGVKLAPVVQELRRRPDMRPFVICTGQHREMLDQALAPFGVRPDVDLGVMSPGQTLHDITQRTLEGIRGVFAEIRPTWVVVQGDTTTAFASALAAFYDKLPVAHVEAGLRSGERYSPFPEEINRRLVDQLSDVLFTPTESALKLLVNEGFPLERIRVTGNTVVDALLFARDAVRSRPPVIEGLDYGRLEGRRVLLVTAHRRESFGPAFESICRALLRIVDAEPDACVVYPVHMNPNVVTTVRRILGNHDRVILLNPLAYLEFVALLDRAYLVLTDSGGVQEEAPTFGKPLLVMRDVTERPEGIDAGVAELVGTDEGRISDAALRLLREPARYAAMSRGVNPYGDGRASRRIVDALDALSQSRRDVPRPPSPSERRVLAARMTHPRL